MGTARQRRGGRGAASYWGSSLLFDGGTSGVAELGDALREPPCAAIAGAARLMLELDVLSWPRHGGGSRQTAAAAVQETCSAAVCGRKATVYARTAARAARCSGCDTRSGDGDGRGGGGQVGAAKEGDGGVLVVVVVERTRCAGLLLWGEALAQASRL